LLGKFFTLISEDDGVFIVGEVVGLFNIVGEVVGLFNIVGEVVGLFNIVGEVVGLFNIVGTVDVCVLNIFELLTVFGILEIIVLFNVVSRIELFTFFILLDCDIVGIPPLERVVIIDG